MEPIQDVPDLEAPSSNQDQPETTEGNNETSNGGSEDFASLLIQLADTAAPGEEVDAATISSIEISAEDIIALPSENIGDKPREEERGATTEENPSYPDPPGEEQPQGSPSNDQQGSEETTNALSQRGSEVEPPKTHAPHLLRPPTHSPTHQQPHRNNGEGNYVAKTNTVQSLRPQIPPMGTPLQPHINVQPSTHFSSFSSHVVAPPYNHSASHQGSTAHSVPLSHSHSVPPSHSNSLPQRPHFQPIPLLPPNTHHSSTYDDSDGQGKKKMKKTPSKKKQKVKKPEVGLSEGDKMSFQEAAVQVLGEQRDKGVYALSTRKIWELISQSGLVDTKCKTPVSSLSSRITEDVRTKGNKSVFVRVGEGLYTLRKGLKKVDLERYLNAKYPNMAHGAELDQQVFDEEEETEESSGVVPDDKSLAFNTRPMPILTQEMYNTPSTPSPTAATPQTQAVPQTQGVPQNNLDTSGEGKKRERSATKNKTRNGENGSVKPNTPVKPTAPPSESPTRSAEMEGITESGENGGIVVEKGSEGKTKEVNRNIQWAGLPLKRKKNGDVHYTSVKVDGHTYKIGDCVYFTPNQDSHKPYIGRISKLWQSNTKAVVNRHGGTMLIETVWYYHPEDTREGRQRRDHIQEVFLSNSSDVNNVNTIMGPAEVVSFPEFNVRVNSMPPGKEEEYPADLYFSRIFYDDTHQTFSPLLVDYDTGKITVGGRLQEKNTPSNWPSDVEVTPSLLWEDISGGVKEILREKYRGYVNIQPVSSTPPDSPTEAAPSEKSGQKLGLYANCAIPENTILGDFSGIVVNRTSEHSGPANPSMVRTLYEDHEILVSIDASDIGNEFRFMRDVTVARKSANVRLSTVHLNGSWLLVVQTNRAIVRGEEIVVDNSESSLPAPPEIEEEDAMDEEEEEPEKGKREDTEGTDRDQKSPIKSEPQEAQGGANTSEQEAQGPTAMEM